MPLSVRGTPRTQRSVTGRRLSKPSERKERSIACDRSTRLSKCSSNTAVVDRAHGRNRGTATCSNHTR